MRPWPAALPLVWGGVARAAELAGSGLPGSGLPGSGLPGSGLPGSGLPGSGLPGAGVAQMLIGLVLVLGLILGAAWLLRRFAPLRAMGGETIRLRGGLALGARERLVLVEVDKVRLLVGVAPGRVQTLYVFPPREASGEDSHGQD